MFKLVVSNTLTLQLRGQLADEGGKSVPFDFTLICARPSATELRDILDQKGTPLVEIMQPRITGWKGVLDADGQPLDFNTDSLASLLDIPGVASLAFNAMVEGASAKGKEKN